MRLLLTSDAFPKTSPKLRKTFFELAGKDPAVVKVAFIPTASEVEEDRTFSAINRKELEEMGIPAENITDVHLDHRLSLDELKRFDVIYVDGGNTFYLLEKAYESGFDAVIREYLEKDLGLYVGGSAGTLIMCPDISIAEPWDDKSKASTTNTKGLGFVKEVWNPHYKDSEKAIVDTYREKSKYPIEELRDGEALVVVDETEELISG